MGDTDWAESSAGQTWSTLQIADTALACTQKNSPAKWTENKASLCLLLWGRELQTQRWITSIPNKSCSSFFSHPDITWCTVIVSTVCMFCDVLQKMKWDACTGRTYGCCQILFAIFASKYKQISPDYFDTGTNKTFFVKKDHFSLFSSRCFCTFRHKSPYRKSPLKHGRQEMLNSVHHNKRLLLLLLVSSRLHRVLALDSESVLKTKSTNNHQLWHLQFQQ